MGLRGGSVAGRTGGASLGGAMRRVRGQAANAVFVVLAAGLVSVFSGTPAGAISPPATTTTLAPPPVADLPLFGLPYAAGSAFRVSQGNAGAYTHQARGPSEFAWDFLMSEGTMVVASRAGRVVAVEGAMSGGGLSALYEGRANYVLLAHHDGLYSVYQHLATAGVLVSPGQWVEAGEGIALSGNTGYSSGPHLHFHVQGAELPRAGRSLPVAFTGAGVPALWALPLSSNGYVPVPPAPLVVSHQMGAAAGSGIPGAQGGPVPEGAGRRALLTHQWLPVSVEWDAAKAPGGAARVRLRTLDGAGVLRELATAPVGGPMLAPGSTGGLAAVAATPTPGWIAVWAEYHDGVRWRVCADPFGRPVAAAYDVSAASVFLGEPGLMVRAGTDDEPAARTDAGVELTAGDALGVEFRVENLGDDPVRLRDVGVELAPAGPAGASTATLRATAGSAIPLAEGALRDLYLLPGAEAVWSGAFTPPTAGIFVLRPVARDAAGKALALPPRSVGGPAAVTVTVSAAAPPPGGDRPGDPGPGDGGAPPFDDVPSTHPAHAAVARLAAHGVVSGWVESDGRRVFRPDDPLARAQFAKMLVRVLGLPVMEGTVCPFVDVERSGLGGLYPDDYIAAAYAADLLRGVSADPPRFEPYSRVTRRQVALVVGRAGLGDPGLPGDPWAAATRGESAVALASLLVP